MNTAILHLTVVDDTPLSWAARPGWTVLTIGRDVEIQLTAEAARRLHATLGDGLRRTGLVAS